MEVMILLAGIAYVFFLGYHLADLVDREIASLKRKRSRLWEF